MSDGFEKKSISVEFPVTEVGIMDFLVRAGEFKDRSEMIKFSLYEFYKNEMKKLEEKTKMIKSMEGIEDRLNERKNYGSGKMKVIDPKYAVNLIDTNNFIAEGRNGKFYFSKKIPSKNGIGKYVDMVA